MDVFVDQDTGASVAALTMVVEDTATGLDSSVFEISVSAHNLSRLATEFQLHLFEIAFGGTIHDTTASSSGSSEGDLVDTRVGGEVVAGDMAVTSDDVHNTLQHEKKGNVSGERGHPTL